MDHPTQNHHAVLVVDMQKAYFNNKALRDQQATLTQRINEIIRHAYAYHLPVFTVRTEHQKDFATWTLNMLSDREGYLFAGEEDAAYVPDLDTKHGIEVLKTRDSAFIDTPLATMLKNHDIETVIICGVSTHTCLFQTASDAYALNINVIIASESVASHKPEYHQVALDILHTEYRQATMTNAELQKYIEKNC